MSPKANSDTLLRSKLGTAIVGAFLVFAAWFAFVPKYVKAMPAAVSLSIDSGAQEWVNTLSKNEAKEILLPKGTLLSCSSNLKNQHCKTAAILAPPSK